MFRLRLCCVDRLNRAHKFAPAGVGSDLRLSSSAPRHALSASALWGAMNRRRSRRRRVRSTPCYSCRRPLTAIGVFVIRYLGMSRQDSLQGALDLMVLKVLSRKPRLHGYVIITAIEEMSDGVLRVEEGSLYPALRRMEEAGWLKAEWITRDAGRRARIYQLTAAGRKRLTAEESRWQTGTAAVNRVLRMA